MMTDKQDVAGLSFETALKELEGIVDRLITDNPAQAEAAKAKPQAIGWFPAGTGPDIGKTDAKSEIWSQRADFDAGMKNFQNAALTFQQAAQGGDLERMKAAHADLGKTCKSCHDRFKQPD